MFNETYSFSSTEAAENFLEENDFQWTSDNSKCYSEYGYVAKIVDYGHRAVVHISKED